MIVTIKPIDILWIKGESIMTKLYNSVADLVGHTPIVKLQHATAENEGNVYVKL